MIIDFDTYLLCEKAKNIEIEKIYEEVKQKSAYQRKKMVNKVIKDYKLNIYFATTFGTSLTFLIPIIENLIVNSKLSLNIGTYEVVLLSIFSISEILNMKNDSIKKMSNDLKEKGLFSLVENVKKSFKSIYKITKEVAILFGKTIERFIEMFGYVVIGIPIWQTLLEITTQDGFNIETLPNKILGLVAGVGVFYLKNLVSRIINLLSKKDGSI